MDFISKMYKWIRTVQKSNQYGTDRLIELKNLCFSQIEYCNDLHSDTLITGLIGDIKEDDSTVENFDLLCDKIKGSANNPHRKRFDNHNLGTVF